MKNLKRIANNPVTNGARLQGFSELLNVNPKVLFLQNDKNTSYHIATVKIETTDGLQPRTAIMYDANYVQGGFKPGDFLLTRVEKTEGYDQPLIVVSHLHAGARATNEDFDFGSAADVVAATAAQNANAIRNTEGAEA